ncbi:hypothetical protein ACN2C6_15925 [Caulobacter sp. ErkDOM-YI]|uniref:hypothetical protein n=1 Tax=unclassified Caulobacter TaxID=2648921 RepID=UPI003AF56B4A
MSEADQPITVVAALNAREERYIVRTIRRYFGENATIRNWGVEPTRMMLHVETDLDIGLMEHECLGLLMCEIQRESVSLESTRRGQKLKGNAKTAYRRGVVLGGSDETLDPASPAWRLYVENLHR